MSTKSMQQSFTKTFDHPAVFPLPVEALPKTPTEILIEASALQPDDHVLVIGRTLSDHLVGLAHHGCGTATGALPDSQCLRMEAADVVWFTGVNDAGSQMTAALRDIGNPRLVAIELPAADDLDWVQNFLRQLAAKGLVHCSYHQVADRLIVTASRPEWLRWVA